VPPGCPSVPVVPETRGRARQPRIAGRLREGAYGAVYPPPGFDLATAWARRSQAFERSHGQLEVTVRVPRSQVRYLRAARVVEDGERPTVIAQFEGLDHAFHNLLAYGPLAEVLAPQAPRERIAAAAAETVALYARPLQLR
jgi:predicted DNA-binding transcriptional regulator YafY